MASEVILTCQKCEGPNARSLPYSMVEPDKCGHCGHPFRTMLDVIIWDIQFGVKQFRQSKLGSFVEAIANTACGYLLALVCMNLIMWAYDYPVTPGQTSIIVGWMTVVSVVRGYAIRRLWNAQFWKWRGRGN